MPGDGFASENIALATGWITPRFVPKHWLGCHVEHGLRVGNL
ncbi:hypothetical protein RBSH_05038 [Rhodopirellula baltica SH28]|uniref:Uncharacterized protein n=2 Tax=Rhodopirellula baltica TaxID=265606 RepID=F2AWD3_RHOBT|nr:hypothetical protein RBWH47_01211 [Rhodopirellula baltica WH47]EKJ99621.1 hypothetical protein RBSH_05038 [Rhodopirellula baltica SH28]